MEIIPGPYWSTDGVTFWHGGPDIGHDFHGLSFVVPSFSGFLGPGSTFPVHGLPICLHLLESPWKTTKTCPAVIDSR